MNLGKKGREKGRKSSQLSRISGEEVHPGKKRALRRHKHHGFRPKERRGERKRGEKKRPRKIPSPFARGAISKWDQREFAWSPEMRMIRVDGV